MKSLRTNRLIFAIGAVVIGIILLIWPGKSLMIIGRCIGAVLAAGGVVAAFLFWKDHEDMSRTLLLVMAAVMLICGIVILIHPDELVKLIPTIMGILAVMSGLINIGETFLLNRKKYGKWWISLLVAALKIAAGIFVIRNAFSLAAIITRVAGGVMIFSGGSDLWVLSRLSVAEKKAAQGSADAPSEADAGPDAPPETPGDAEISDAAPTGSTAVPATPVDTTPEGPAASAASDTAVQESEAAGSIAPASPVDAAPETPAADIEGSAPADAAEVHPEDSGNVSPGLVWDDDSVAIGEAEASKEADRSEEGADKSAESADKGGAPAGEVPEYMLQEDQPGDYKIPGEDA